MRYEIAEWAYGVSGFMLSVIDVAAPLIFVGFVLSIFRRTRPWTGLILWVFSYPLGAATWFWGAAITFSSFGWIGLGIGLLVVGVGVVPLGMLAAYMDNAPDASVTLILMVVGTFALRGVGMWLMEPPPPRISEPPAPYL